LRKVRRHLQTLLAAFLTCIAAQANAPTPALPQSLDLGRAAESSDRVTNVFRALSLEKVAESAQRGDPDAQYELGVRIGSGAGPAKGEAKALEWFQKAAESGHAGAAYELGHAYTFGDGVQTNFSLALTWYESAAKGGYLPAH